MPKEEISLVKVVISLLIANGIRLLKIIPNNDPIMSMALPFSRRTSATTSFAFPFVTMVSFDYVTGYLGMWTVVTSITYGALGLAFHYLLKDRKEVGMKIYLGFGIVGVLIFDFITGVVATPFLVPGMTFAQAFIGQVPFTIKHLVTSSAFIIIVTPLLDKQILLNKNLDDRKVANALSRIVYNV